MVTLVAVGYLVIERKRHAAMLLAVAVGGGTLLSSLLKLGFDRPRPDLVSHLVNVETLSFPSGHALNSILFYGLVALMLAQFLHQRAARSALYAISVALSLTIGLSRIALGVHYPSDVVAGWLIGASWLSLWVILAKRFWPKAFPTRSVKNNL